MAVVNFVNSELNANVTTFKDEDGKIWFKAKDVAHALEYVNPGKAVRAHVRDKHKKTFEELQGGSILNPQPQTVFIQEPGVYQLVFSSKLPSATEFQDWDFEEVIPSIRKTGTYTSVRAENHKEYYMRRSDSVRRRRTEGVQTNPQNATQHDKGRQKNGDGQAWWSKNTERYS